MSFPYPAKPWQDGQQVNVAMADGTYVIGQYNASKNLWSFRRFRQDQVNREQIFTYDVLTTGSQPAPKPLSPFDTSDPTNLQTQQEVNWFLWNYIRDLEVEGAQLGFSTECTMLQAPADIDETFERDPVDYDRYGSALFYINAPDHEQATRIVVPKIDSKDFDWSAVLRAHKKGDVIMSVQLEDFNTPDVSDDIDYRSEWRIINEPVENQFSFSFEVEHVNEQPQHLPSFNEKAYIRLITSQGYVLKSGDTMTGKLIMDDADIELDNGNIEFEAKGDTAYVQDANNRFGKIVSRAPKDTTTGSANYTGSYGIKVDINEGNTYRNRFIVGNQHGDIVTVTGGNGAQIEFATSGFKPNLQNTGLTSGIAIRHIPTPDYELSPGDLAVNKQYVDNRDEQVHPAVKEHICAEFFKVVNNSTTVEGSSVPSIATNDSGAQGIQYWTTPPQPDFFVDGESYYINDNGPYQISSVTESDELVTFFIDGGLQPALDSYCAFSKTRKLCTEVAALNAADEQLRQDILELEEEIDAIAPTTQRGEWHFDKDKPFPDPGDYYLVKGASSISPATTEFYSEADAVVFHNVDANGVINTWSNVTVGELIQIYDQPDPDFVLGTITNVDTAKISNAVWIEFDRISAEGSPNNNPDIKLSRINIFEAPSGGNASGFVLKTGDTMTGELKIVKDNEAAITLSGKRDDLTHSVATVAFNSQNDTDLKYAGYLTYRNTGTTNDGFFRFNRNLEILDTLKTNKISTYSGDTTTFDKRLDFTQSSNVNARFQKGFVVKEAGESIGGANVFGAYDTHVEYNGPITSDNHIATKEYVDSKASGVKITCDEQTTVGAMWYCSTDQTLYIKVS